MWHLPALFWNDTTWRLPLSAETAGALVTALVADPSTREAALADLLGRDRALVTWVVCTAPAWRQTPPADSWVLADWLWKAIPAGVFFVEPAFGPMGNTSVPPSRNEEPAAPPRNVLQEIQRSSDSPVLDRLRDCPWLPSWLDPGELGKGESGVVPPGSATDLVAASPIGSLLLQVLALVRRTAAREAEFDAELEREKLASLREFAYGASHEINNPLANIATRAQALLRDEPDAERKRKLSTIAAQAFRAHEMIADMMLFAKPPQPQRQRVDLGELALMALRELTEPARLQETEIYCEPPERPVILSADPTQLGVALQALVRNALEALKHGGTVTIGIHQREPDSFGVERAEIVVRDTGPGIPPEVRRHLFDPFYSGREAGRGLGFGLSKCWRIAEMHGGSIRVESQPGAGATFTLSLPLITPTPADAPPR